VKEVLGIIPARYESSRFPGKPLAIIHQKPMIQWVYERAATVMDHLCVATDDIRIKSAVEAFGGMAVMTSPDHKTGTDRCREALELIRLDRDIFKYVINIQGDEPLLHTEQLTELINCFAHPGVDIATLIQPFSSKEEIANPNQVKVVIDKHARALYFSRAPIPYIRNSTYGTWMKSHRIYRHMGLYAFTVKALNEITSLQPTELEMAESLEQLRWLENGYRIQTTISNYQSIGVDTPEDLEKIERLLGD